MKKRIFFRLTVSKSSIEDEHVEDFMDTTVEWLSSDPQKGILIDFSGVEWICDEFVSHLATYYADLKKTRHLRSFRECST